MSPFDLILNAAKSIGSAGKSAVTSLFNTDVGKLTGNTQNNATIPGIIANTVLGLPKATLGVGKELVQGTARGLGNLGQAVASPVLNVATKGKVPIGSTVQAPQGKFMQALYGTDKPFSFTSETAPLLNMAGIKEGSKTSKILSPIIGSALALSDAIPGGKGVRAVTTEVLKSFAKATTREAVFEVAKKAGIKLSEEIAKKIAKTEDTKVIMKLGNFSLPKTTAKILEAQDDELLLRLEEIRPQMDKVVNGKVDIDGQVVVDNAIDKLSKRSITNEERQSAYEAVKLFETKQKPVNFVQESIAAGEAKTKGQRIAMPTAMAQTTPTISNTSSRIIDNSIPQNFKTAEEFVKAMKGSATQYGEYRPNMRADIPAGYKNITEMGIKPDEMVTVYRGIDDIKGNLPRKINDGDFVTTDFDSALSYAGSAKDVVEMKVPAKTLYNSEPRDFIDEPFYTGAEYIYTSKTTKSLPSDSQLTDIWNKANGKPSVLDTIKRKLGGDLPNKQGGFISMGGKKEVSAVDRLTTEAKTYKTVGGFVSDITNQSYNEFYKLKKAVTDLIEKIPKDKNGNFVYNTDIKTKLTKANRELQAHKILNEKELTDIWNKAQGVSIPSQKIKEVLPTERQTTATLDRLSSKENPRKLSEPTNLNQSRGLSYTDKIPQNFNPDKYVAEQVAKREGARVAEKSTIVAKTKSFLANAKAKLVDFTAPIEDVLNAAVKKNKLTILPENNIHNQIDRVLRSPTLAGQFAKDHGLVNIIKKIDNLDNLDQYLIAKHAIELDTRGINTGRNIKLDEALVKALGPKYEVAAKVVSNYSKELLNYSVDSGLISKDVADMLKKRYPDYVPFSRVFNEVEKAGGNKTAGGVASLSRQNIVQKIEGSSREIESPIQSLLAKTNDAFKQGEKNIAGKMLASYEKLPDNPFQLKEIEAGLPGERGGTISFLDNGVKRTFETTPEIANAAKSLNVQQLNILGKIFAFPTRIARIGITGINLPFVGANIAKDQVTGFINSNHGLKTSIANPVNFVKSLFSAVGHGKLYEEMVRAGGAGTSFDISRNQVAQTVDRIRSGKSVVSKIKYTVRHPSELLRAVEDIIGRSEELTRIQQYRGSKEALLKQGMDAKNATIGAARQAREATVNFARRGEWGTVLNSTFLYLNASIQGTRTLLGNLKTKPGQTAVKIAIAALFPVAVATTWNLSDKKRKEAYDDIAEYEKENNIIIIPPNPTKDANGKWNVIKIPLSQEINNLVGMARRPIEAAYGLDPLAFGDFAKAFIGTVSPIAPTKGSVLSTLTPQALKPTIEAATNTNLFTGYPQVSQGLENLSPENQIKADTSSFAINTGKVLGVSPIKIDEFIKGTFGSVGSQVTGKQNVLEAVYARFGKAQGGALDNELYTQQQAVDQQVADVNAADKQRVQPVYDKVQALLASGDTQGALDLANTMSEADKAVYAKIKTAVKSKATLQTKRETLPVYNQVQDLLKQGKKDEALKLANSLTPDQQKAYASIKADQKKIVSAQIQADKVGTEGLAAGTYNNQSFLTHVLNGAKAIGTDPVTYFNRVFSGEKVVRVENGAIYVERMPLSASQAESKAQGGGSNMRLDHVVSLELGGDNSKSNLKLVPEAVWASYTPVENALGTALRAGKINKSKAQELIKKFKAGEVTASEIYDIIK